MISPRIAIIGGGASMAALLGNLMEVAPDFAGRIDLYDRSGRWARGVAYSTQNLSHLLNVRAGNMSAIAARPDHFANWAAGQGYDSHDFVPRKIYGDYLNGIFEDARARFDIHCHEQDVEGCRLSGDGVVLNGGELIYDHVILAGGNVMPLRPRQIAPDARHYFDDPWNLDAGILRGCREIALIGAGLTAMDAALALMDMEFDGQITIISRHGAIPQIHADPAAPFKIEADDVIGKTPAAIMKFLRRATLKAAAQGLPWQAVLDGIRPHTNAIWQGWSAAQKSSFMRHAYTIWGVHRHRMAGSIGARIAGLAEAGRLEFIKARVASVTAQGLLLDNGAIFAADAAINCMGYRYAEGGRDYNGALRLGPANFGDMFETTAMPEIRAQAGDLAKKIAGI